MNYTADAPAVWDPAFADAGDCLLSSDQCVVRAQHYFVKGLIEIPVIGTDEPVYAPTTLNLKTHVHTRPAGERPYVELEPTDHPLAVEQRTGMTVDRVREIAAALFHSAGSEPL
ncbi:DUF2199 domain-containing protein [Streptomyces sp. NPDC051211]|uniref:DUF2199 domain-containing protein n=1 Tax=Streptomyces sp. NPDC051211 TaxID=3154643 RepID=UPI00344F7F1C